MLRRAALYTVSLPLLYKEQLVNVPQVAGMFCEYCFMKHQVHPVIRRVIGGKCDKRCGLSRSHTVRDGAPTLWLLECGRFICLKSEWCTGWCWLWGNVALAFLVAPGEISQITWRLLSLTSRVSNIVRFLFPVTQSWYSSNSNCKVCSARPTSGKHYISQYV